jgi:hypothetical protein
VRICESEAQWVRKAFNDFAHERKSIQWIARELTRLHVDKGRKSNSSGWHHQQVRRMLANAKYAGVWTWGKTTTRRNSQGKIKLVAVPPGKQVVRQRADLRIVDQATWDIAQRRLQELRDAFGMQPGQRPRGPKVHHTEIYPASLLGGLIYCHACGARLWVQGRDLYKVLICPNRAKGMCERAPRVPERKAEEAIITFVADLLKDSPGWLESATDAMQAALTEAAERAPSTLKEDERRLAETERKIGNVVDRLADGVTESPALRERLSLLEREATELRASINVQRRAQQGPIAMPDSSWVKQQLRQLGALLHGETANAAPLLRELLGRVTAESIVAPGKKRGFVRLHLHVREQLILRAAIAGAVPDSVARDALSNTEVGHSYTLDLGKPTRFDAVAPEIVAMRSRGLTWEVIGQSTGVGTGNAFNIWKRAVNSTHERAQETA